MNRFNKLLLIFFIIIESKILYIHSAPTSILMKKLTNKGELDIEAEDCGELEIYDQRQNGTENYHIAVDGLVFIVAPPEVLESLDTDDFFNEKEPVNIQNSTSVVEDDYLPVYVSRPTVETTTEKNLNHKKYFVSQKQQIKNMLIPLLRRSAPKIRNKYDREGTNVNN